ncbi:ABC transporter substrate-binding protein [Spongiibacter nanhainus]|uniref:ABC transporter substrate-binding protein n=1 Tax=Spongiibacter nanhainus TaxID=2794344 RepID=A0A7T4R051_9GAMM|nr:ABC transporter substrate-binding protein [Spongiibacter nanhainus]QQD17877.1 ABC transporter substrate-binding protein [Spongiibacter nanhainus]
MKPYTKDSFILISIAIAIAALALFASPLCASTDGNDKQPVGSIEILYVEQVFVAQPTLSNIRPPAEDSGAAGALLGVADNNTTGRFLGQHYRVKVIREGDPKTLIARVLEHIDVNGALILAHLPTGTLQQLAQSSGLSRSSIIFNVSNQDNVLRTNYCRPRLLHTSPSRAMLTDALAQFLVAKGWQRWLLLHGPYAEDKRYADSVKHSAKRFGATLVDQRQWSFDSDLRRSAQKEIRLFSQAKNYDVTVIADERGDIGEYIPYNTWLARPAAGTQGLKPTAWHWSVEQWGATQLQERFRASASRDMNDLDYAAWLAVRVIGEAVTRTNSDDLNKLYRYILSDRFEVSGFKGRPLSFRSWNGQLRQPIPLAHPRSLVSQSPQAGFLHPRSEMDTLGFDQPEVECQFAQPSSPAEL